MEFGYFKEEFEKYIEANEDYLIKVRDVLEEEAVPLVSYFIEDIS